MSRLSDLLEPVGLRSFLRDSFAREPVLIRGASDRVAGLLSLERLAGAVMRRAQEQGQVHVTAEALEDESALAAYLAEGKPIIWNAARGASPALDELTTELAQAFRAHVWANVYATGAAVKPFEPHFDAHDVLAVQCEGAKEWTVSKVRLNCPLDVPVLKPMIRRALDENRAEAMADPLMTVVTRPGDVLYLPRGQFHDARTLEGRSLHVTFAIAPPTGIDVLNSLAVLALGEALFRDYLPHPLNDDDGALTRAHLEQLAERLSALARSEELRQAIGRWHELWLTGSS